MAQIATTHTRFLVDSDTQPGVHYRVDLEQQTCSCPARKRCKHLEAANRYHNAEVLIDTCRHFITPLVPAPAVDSREASPMAEPPRRGRRDLYGSTPL